MDIIELFIDEEDEVSGIEAVSIVESPAIESDFIALKNQEFKFAEVNKEKRILMGAALIPNKPIYRKNEENEYYIYFSKSTVRKASELFFIRGNQNNSTLEHNVPLTGLTAVESWIVEDEKDKTRFYDLDVPIGTWMLSMKVQNDDVWNDYVKTGKVKGFSIEGYFADKLERPKDKVKDDLSKKDKTSLESKIIDGRIAYDTKEEAIAISKEMGCSGYHSHNLDGQDWFMPCESHELNKLSKELIEIEEAEAHYLLGQVTAIIKKDKRTKAGKKTEMKSYSDYPNSVSNNAKRGIALNEKVNNKCATQVGKIRAQQLANGKPISKETIKRMFSYLSRAEVYYEKGDTESCGYISFLLWGGKSAKSWAESKIKSLENE